MHADTPILQRQQAVLGVDRDVGNSTNDWKVLTALREEAVVIGPVITFTDVQIWDSRWGVPGDAKTGREALEPP